MEHRGKEGPFAVSAEILDRFSRIEGRLDRIEKTQAEFQKYWPYLERIFNTLERLYGRLGEVNQMTHDLADSIATINQRLDVLKATSAATQDLVRNGPKK
jgi:DNA-binding FrmR family transcriptional regulator